MEGSLFELLKKPFTYDKDTIFPSQGIVSITNRCNLNCLYCFHTQSDFDMDFHTADMTARYLLSNAIPNKIQPGFTFFGGEPLLKFEEIIKPLVLKYKDSFGWSITTNGTLLTEEIIDFCVKYNISILLSIDGGEIIQNKQRPLKDLNKKSFDEIKKIIPYLLLKMPNTIFRATLTKFSLNHINEIIDVVNNFNFRYITLVPNLFEEWEPEDYYKWEQFIDFEAIKIMQKLSWGEPLDYILTNLVDGVKLLHYQENQNELEDPMSRCGMGLYGIGVSPNGSLHPCQENNGYNEESSIGDIYHGINYEIHYNYCKNIYEKWLQYIENIDNLPGSLNFKLFFANNYCSTRIDDNCAFNNTQIYYMRALHRACSRLFQNYRFSLNPMSDYLFEI